MSGIKANFSYAFVAQSVSMLISAVVVLIVPRTVDVLGYGQIQYFLLISGYAGLFALGISDGMYLRCGGGRFKDFEGNRTFKGEFATLALLSLLECLAVFSLTLLTVHEASRAFVYQCFALYLPLHLLNNYLGYILQSCGKIKEYSFSSVIEKTVCLLMAGCCVFLEVGDFRPYVFAYAIGKFIALCYNVIKCRRILAGSWPNRADVMSSLKEDVPAGLRLTFSTLVAQLILGVGRFFVDSSFGVEEFSQVSLAISLMNFFLVFINQVGMVLFPALRRFKAERLSVTYDTLCGSVLVILPFVLIAYFPISWFISWWLPAYSAAVQYLGILLPICYFDGKSSMIYITFLKVKRGESALLRVNIVALVVSAALCALFSFGFRSVDGVVVSLLVATAVRNVLLSRASDSAMDKDGGINGFAELSLIAVFVLANLLLAPQFAFFSVAAFSAAYIVMQRRWISMSAKSLWALSGVRSRPK